MRHRLAIVASIAVGCAPAARSPLDFRALDQPIQPPPLTTSTLDARAVAADLDRLALALERGYVGKPFVPAESWRRMEDRLAALRERELPVRALCNRIADALWEIPDSHLAARYRAPGSKTSRQCGTGATQERVPRVGANAGAEATTPWSVTTTNAGTSRIAILAITTFPPRSDPSWNDFEAALAGILEADGLAVDLRGNGGGDDARGRELANRLVDGVAAVPVTRWHSRQSAEALTLLTNYLATQGSAPHLQNLLASARAERDRAAASRLPEWKVEEERTRTTTIGPRAYRGPVAILVDAACASSCESTLEMLRQHPGARVFGEPTAGHVGFGDIGTFALPNSRIRIILPTAFAELAGGFRGRRGFDPDVPVPAGTDALEAARGWLQSSPEKHDR
jgi:hypothetical protein